jgi:hypothetical protein
MPTTIQTGASIHGTALNHDFQKTAVGSLGGRTVQQGTAQAPRRDNSPGFFKSIKILASRALNAVTPNSVRASSRVREALREADGAMGRIFQAIAESPSATSNPAQLAAMLEGLASVAAPVTSRGATLDQVVAGRAMAALPHMSAAERESLVRGILHLEQGALQGNASLALLRKSMEQCAAAEGAGAVKSALEKVIAGVAQEARNEGRTQFAFNELYDTARESLRKAGMGPEANNKSLQRAMILSVLDGMVEGKVDTPEAEPIAQMFNALTSKELHALAHESRALGFVQRSDIGTMLTRSIEERAQQLQSAVQTGMQTLMSRGFPVEDDPQGALHDPVGYAKTVASTGRAWVDLRDHAQRHQMAIPAHLQAALPQVQAHLGLYLTPDRLNMALPELSAARLESMRKGLAGLEVTAGQAEFAAHAAERRTVALDAYANAVAPALSALHSDDVPGMLRALEAAQPLGDAALRVHMSLGRKIDGQDDTMAFREDLTSHAIASLDVRTLRHLAERLTSPQGQALWEELGVRAMPFITDLQVGQVFDASLGHSIFDRCQNLMMLTHCVKHALQKQGVMVDNPHWAAAPSVEAVLQQTYGLSTNSAGSQNVRKGLGGEAMKDAMQANLQEMLDLPESDPRDKQFPLVTDGFVRDLKRDAYYAPGPNRNDALLYDKSSTAQSPQVALQAAIGQLQTLAGGDDAVLMMATRMANQNVLAGLQKALMSQDSPLRLPDGTPGRLLGEERNEYRFSSDGDGGLLLQVQHTVSNAGAFLPAPLSAEEGVGVPVALDAAQSSARFAFQVHIAADQSVRISKPVHYEYDAVLAA